MVGDTITGGLLTVAGALSGVTTIGSSGLYTATVNSIGETSATADAAHLIISTTAASAGTQEYSPTTIWGGSGWKTDATAASQAVRFMAQVIPVQGAAAPTGALHFFSDIADGGYTSRMNLSSAGQLTLGNGSASAPVLVGSVATAGFYFSAGGLPQMSSGNTLRLQIGNSIFATAHFLPSAESTYTDGQAAGGGGASNGGWLTFYQQRDGIGAVSTDAALGYESQNEDVASAGAQQFSPMSVWEGQGWKTDATAASRNVKFGQQVIPVEGAANPTGGLHWFSEINDAGFVSRMNLDSAGNLTITGSGKLGVGVTPVVTVDIGSTSTPMQQTRWSDSAGAGSGIAIRRSRGASVGSDTVVVSGDNIGLINFQAFDGSAFVQAAQIKGLVDGVPAVGDMPGGLVFYTTPPGATTAIERMKLNSAGVLTTTGFHDRSVLAGITASTTQAQGNGALTNQINEVDSANSLDVVTLPVLPASGARTCTVINNSLSTIQIFPASGDNLGRGLNLAESLETNETVEYIGYDATNWKRATSTEIIHAEMVDEDNDDSFLIVSQDEFHCYHTNGLVAGDLINWTFDAGGAGTSFPVASIANSPASGGSAAEITTTGSHLVVAGDIVSLTNMSAGTNAGIHIVIDPVTATTFEITTANSTTATGTMNQAAGIICGTGAQGAYLATWSISGSSDTNNETFDFKLLNRATDITGTKARDKFGTAGDYDSSTVTKIITVAAGDLISWALLNQDTAGDFTARHLTLTLSRQ